MNKQNIFFLLAAFALFGTACGQNKSVSEPPMMTNETTEAQEKAAILAVLNNETKAAFERDYELWKTYWVYESYVSKTYLNFADSTMTETLGWQQVDDFVRTYIAEHPQPAPLPDPLTDIDVRLYGTGAAVTYEQIDPERGRKREMRLMEKSSGEWRIAGMQTVIYGDVKQF